MKNWRTKRKKPLYINTRNSNNTSKRRKSSIIGNVIVFSIIKVKYPENYEEEYRRIRRSLNLNERDDDDDDDEVGENENNFNYMNIETNSVERLIREGRSKVTISARYYDGNMKENKIVTLKTKGTVYLPFIEPYFIYEVVIEPANDSKYVDYYIKKIINIKLAQLGFRDLKEARLHYIFKREMELKDSKIKKIIKKLKNKKNKNNQGFSMETKLTSEDFKCLKGKIYDGFKKTLYSIYEKATEAIAYYKGAINF